MALEGNNNEVLGQTFAVVFQYCELQYKRQLSPESSIANAEM